MCQNSNEIGYTKPVNQYVKVLVMKTWIYLLTLFLFFPVCRIQADLAVDCPVVFKKFDAPSRIFFDLNSAKISKRGFGKLEKLRSQIVASGTKQIKIIGHTDERGSREYNIDLAMRRAVEVKRYLQAGGVTVPMELASMGEERPLIHIQKPLCWDINSRVEIKIGQLNKNL